MNRFLIGETGEKAMADKLTREDALALLQEKGLVQKALYSDVHLTPAGEALARELEAQRDGLFLLFLRRYGLSHEESLQAAFLLMHGLKKESLEKLLAQEE